MTALATTIFTAIIILGAATFLIIWTLDNVREEAIRTTAIIIYGFCFIITIATVLVEAIKASF
ncbi:hypothetical protein [Bacillus sp. UMB0893]|uniref:hypothetical protein n=1 Tax=Bacillus sp. UMB0893 TaxID=2066053 RepID=UPI0008A86F7B|nr:hypothetical protein [Bacillus sp. UMB0893]OHR63536.1 hypothetical protein HMPREF3291_16575 [Bacillus sp. HMSC76G11]PLR65671.1 hypothetical protein CYJ36_22770 [Bacillus sp. UMB0893]